MPARNRRPWDEALAPILRVPIMKRRMNPDGDERKVRTFTRGGEKVNAYPWPKMLVGDFFIVGVGARSPRSMEVAFRQAAARHDIEVSIQPWKMPDGSDGFRVIKVQENIKAIKKKAGLLRGMKIPASDGRWKDRRKNWHLRRVGAIDDEPDEPRLIASTTATEAPGGVGEAVAADVGYDRAERLRLAREAARAEVGITDPDEEDYLGEIVE